MPRHGPRTQFPGKDRANPTSICLTPLAKRILVADAKVLERSQSDHIEFLLRQEHSRLARRGKATTLEAVV